MADRGGRFAGLGQLTLVRLREFFREPEALFWVFVFPILLAAGLGIAFRNRAPQIVDIGLRVDTPAAGGYAQALARAGKLGVHMVDSTEGYQMLRNGTIALLVTPIDNHRVKMTYDPTNYDGQIARGLANDRVQRLAGREDVFRVEDDLIRTAGSRYIDFLIPGLIGMNLMASGIWGIGYAVVDARRRKLLKRLVATPMSRAEYLASFLLSRLILLVLEVGAVLAFGMIAFGVPMRGSPVAFAVVAILAALAFGAIGLLAAARPQTIEGASGLMNLVMLPMWVLGGVFFSVNRFPETMRPAIHLLPLTAANDALRDIALNGASLASQHREMLILAGWLVLAFPLALRLFRWR